MPMSSRQSHQTGRQRVRLRILRLDTRCTRTRRADMFRSRQSSSELHCQPPQLPRLLTVCLSVDVLVPNPPTHKRTHGQNTPWPHPPCPHPFDGPAAVVAPPLAWPGLGAFLPFFFFLPSCHAACCCQPLGWCPSMHSIAREARPGQAGSIALPVSLISSRVLPGKGIPSPHTPPCSDSSPLSSLSYLCVWSCVMLLHWRLCAGDKSRSHRRCPTPRPLLPLGNCIVPSRPPTTRAFLAPRTAAPSQLPISPPTTRTFPPSTTWQTHPHRQLPLNLSTSLDKQHYHHHHPRPGHE